MRRWPEIFEANRDQIKDPNVIQVGQKLRIPVALAEAASAAASPEPAASPKPENQAAAGSAGTEAPAAEDTGSQERHVYKGKRVGQE